MPATVSTTAGNILFRAGTMGLYGVDAVRTTVCPMWNEISIDDIYIDLPPAGFTTTRWTRWLVTSSSNRPTPTAVVDLKHSLGGRDGTSGPIHRNGHPNGHLHLGMGRGATWPNCPYTRRCHTVFFTPPP